MAENNIKETPKVEAKVDAANKKVDGDVLMLIEAEYIEHGGLGFSKGMHVWMDDSAARFHATLGSARRVA
jgi:hypothetical protein